MDEIDFNKDAINNLDVINLGEGSFQILMNNKNYSFRLIENSGPKTYKVQINSRIYTIDLKDHLDLMVDRLGLSVVATHKINEVKAPMPGLVIDILVKQGQTIQKGDSLIILEAMKMENIIKSTGDGVIDIIQVEKGQPVKKTKY